MVTRFRQPPSEGWSWYNEPKRWSLVDDGRLLRVEVEAGTNFWQRTRHGRREDNGHFFGVPLDQDFAMRISVRTDPRAQYDQAGVMIRRSAECWMKASVEYETTEQSDLGAVVTNLGWSDWSFSRVAAAPVSRWRVLRVAGDIVIEGSVGDEEPIPLRIAHLIDADQLVHAGIYACSPRGVGFTAWFSEIDLSPL